jgi:hypothetical protein
MSDNDDFDARYFLFGDDADDFVASLDAFVEEMKQGGALEAAAGPAAATPTRPATGPADPRRSIT